MSFSKSTKSFYNLKLDKDLQFVYIFMSRKFVMLTKLVFNTEYLSSTNGIGWFDGSTLYYSHFPGEHCMANNILVLNRRKSSGWWPKSQLLLLVLSNNNHVECFPKRFPCLWKFQ